MTPAPSSPVPPNDLLAHAGFVRGLARALVSGDADVDDVVQETWVAALGSRASVIRRPRSWLASIVRRRAARHYRTRARIDKRHAEGATSVEVPTPDDVAARHETIQKVSAALAALPAHYRDVLVLRYYEELPPREVARRLGIPVETARTRIRRGLVRLREILDEKHDGRRAAWAMPLAGLVSSGTATVGIGALAVGGIAVAALLVLGFILIPRLLTERTATDAGESSPPAAEVTPPTLVGRGDAEKREPEHPEVLAGPSDEDPVPPVPADEEAKPEDEPVDTIEVVVRVVDEKGQPVAGLGIAEQTRGDGGPFDITARHVGRTDATGRLVVFASPEAIGFMVEKNDAWQYESGSGQRPKPGMEVVLRVTPTIVIKGMVTNEAGEPVEGVRVLASFPSRSDPGSTETMFLRLDPTGPDGRFSTPVPSYVREVRLRAGVSGANALLHFDPHVRGDVVLRLLPPIWIRGEVVTEDGGAIDPALHGALLSITLVVDKVPAPEVVSVVRYTGDLGVGAPETVTDGRLELRLAPGTTSLVIGPAGGDAFHVPVRIEVDEEATSPGARVEREVHLVYGGQLRFSERPPTTRVHLSSGNTTVVRWINRVRAAMQSWFFLGRWSYRIEGRLETWEGEAEIAAGKITNAAVEGGADDEVTVTEVFLHPRTTITSRRRALLGAPRVSTVVWANRTAPPRRASCWP